MLGLVVGHLRLAQTKVIRVAAHAAGAASVCARIRAKHFDAQAWEGWGAVKGIVKGRTVTALFKVLACGVLIIIWDFVSTR